MLQRRLSTAISTVLLFTSTSLAADQILLDDGSILKGSIKQISEGKVVMDTAFADEITVDFNRVTQISTDQKHLIELDSSDRVLGQLTVNDKGQHQLTGTAFGTVDIDPKRINTLWEKDAVQPQNAQLEQQYQQEIEQIKTAQAQEKAELEETYTAEVQQLRAEREALLDPWSGNLAFGIQGASGNTDRMSVTGRGELFRETENERLGMYLEVNYAKEDDEQTENEKLAGIKLERDISENYFARGSADFEIDDFEELDLRAIATASLGRFFIQEPDLIFKGFAGVGYRFESYSDGTTEKDPTGVLGYETNYNLNSRMNLFHDLTYYPSFSSPGQNYLLVTNFGAEMPITNDEAWKLRASLRSQYNSQPAGDAETTDTNYRLNLVYDWE
ncbi:MAG: DUF481 domain-containing protein [Methylophaga sp.]|uniref:DUF481 domain-containing protein n=1 Tax=Methylophaga sp. TaxID=2024840 RepID=UPI00299D24DE|nr:DUF481 domain-containing protein [Methylophaga sp.]MDX1749124.1 DUF481 domain-containing protein [Methylophaga sp.]